MTEFPNVFSITNLKELNLNSNRISSIPDRISELQHLTQLDLGNNLIESVGSLRVLASLPVCSVIPVSFVVAHQTERCAE